MRRSVACAYQHGNPAEDVEGDEPMPRGGRRRGSGDRAGLEVGPPAGARRVVAPDELVPAHGARRPPLPAAPRSAGQCPSSCIIPIHHRRHHHRSSRQETETEGGREGRR
jgi:hypothetical protein